MKAPMRRASLVPAVAVAAAVLVMAAAAPAAPSAPAKISSVTFTGSEAKPTITIRGRNLGTRPRPNPVYHPLGHPPLCPPAPTKPLAAYGFDYGTSVFLEDRTQQPVWSAGRYRPRVNELDCVGVVFAKFTPTVVVLRLGAFYGQGRYHLARGDAYRLGVNAARFSGRVRYR